MLYIADRDNHVIRGMSAACSFNCENSGRCVGPNKCECLHGWSGIDCTKPSCQNSCGQRELCVAPNTCDCIPGYDGAGCLAAKCSQQCVNGHCSAPDVCTCNIGWFDSNCVSSAECGNFHFIFQAANNHSSSLDATCRRRPCVNRHVETAVSLAFTCMSRIFPTRFYCSLIPFKGNCTGPNICTCPEDFTGEDCRTPVCDQNCLNGGWCVAPNTCQCPPGHSGYDCSMPVCHQGFFVPHENLPGWMIGPTTKHHWLEHQPCNFTHWCNETRGFDCAQTDRRYAPATPHFGMKWRCDMCSE